MAIMNSQGYEAITGYGIASNDAGSVDIVEAQGVNLRVRINQLTISVYEAAKGGGGMFELRHQDGTVFHKLDADEVKDLQFDFGEAGYDVGDNEILQGLVYGAETAQASVSMVWSGFLSRE